MKKRIIVTVLAAAMTLSLEACSGSGQTQGAGSNQAEDVGSNQAEDAGSSQTGGTGSSQAGDTDNRRSRRENATFDQMKEKVKGTTVTFYGWGGDKELNRWLDGEFTRVIKERCDITMERVLMNIDQVLSQLTGEIQAGEKDGSIDIIQINRKNFQSAEEDSILYGPFTDKLSNSSNHVDGKNEDIAMDFTYSIGGCEAPYGKAQLVMVADLAVTSGVPKSARELEEFVEKYPGKVTYPAFPDFTGSVFVRDVIYEICGYKQLMDMAAGEEIVRIAVAPAMECLRELNPYLWNQGAVLPDSSTTADNMFADRELVMSMTYGAYGVALSIKDGKYIDTTAAFQFEKGAIDNIDFMAIATNSGNRAGVIMTINEMISPEIRVDCYERLRVIPVLDSEKLSDEQKAASDRADLDKGTIPQNKFLSKRLPEIPARLAPIIEGAWTEEVVGK